MAVRESPSSYCVIRSTITNGQRCGISFRISRISNVFVATVISLGTALDAGAPLELRDPLLRAAEPPHSRHASAPFARGLGRKARAVLALRGDRLGHHREADDDDV